METKSEITQQLVKLIKPEKSKEFDEFLAQHQPFNDYFNLNYQSQPLIYIAIKQENEHAAIKLINEIKVFNKEHLNRKYNYKTLLDYAKSKKLSSVEKVLIDARAGTGIQDKHGQKALLLKETEEKRRTSAPVCQIQLIDSSTTNNEDTSLSESNDLLAKIIQDTITNDDQALKTVCYNIDTQDNSKLDLPLDPNTQDNLKLNSSFKPIEEEQQASLINIGSKRKRENNSEKPSSHYKKSLLSRYRTESEQIDLLTHIDLSTSNTNRSYSNINIQDDSELNSLNHNANKRTEMREIEPSTSLSFTDEPNILSVCENSRVIK